MDGERFDRLTRSLAAGVRRRSILRTLVGGALGLAGASRLVEDASAACTRYGRPCSGATCCNGAECIGGRCGCADGDVVCSAPGVGTSCRPACPCGQVMGSGCRCLCRTTGRPATDAPCNDPACCSGEGEIPSAEFPCCEGLVEDEYERVCVPEGECTPIEGECFEQGTSDTCCSRCCIQGICVDGSICLL